MPNDTIVDSFRQIEPWLDDEQKLLDGVRKKVTPNGKQPAEVMIVAHDTIAAICSALVSETRGFVMARYAFREPMLVKVLPGVAVLHHKHPSVALYGEYTIREPTVVFFFALGEGVLKPTYVVCHPEFPVDYPKGFGNEKLLDQVVRSPHRSPVRR